MAELQVKPGTKLQIAFDAPVGQQVNFNMMATFREAIDDAYFLISVPALAGKPLIVDENQKFLMQYQVGDQRFMIAGYPEAVVKQGIRTFWKMRQVAEQRVFFKRKDERFKVAMRVEYQRDFPDVGEALQVRMPAIRLQGERHEIAEQLGIVCWLRPAPKGSLYRNVCGLQFRYANDLEREAFKEYISYVRTKYKL